MDQNITIVFVPVGSLPRIDITNMKYHMMVSTRMLIEDQGSRLTVHIRDREFRKKLKAIFSDELSGTDNNPVASVEVNLTREDFMDKLVSIGIKSETHEYSAEDMAQIF